MSDLLGAIMSPLGLASLAIVVAAVGAVYYFQVLWKRKKVWLLRPRDMRGLELTVKLETNKGLGTEKKEGVTRRFLKYGRGYTFPNGTRFIGIEGTAYTGEVNVTVPTEKITKVIDPETGDETENKEIEEIIKKTKVTLSESLKLLWTPAEYAKMPQNLRDLVEKAQWGLIVEADPIDTKSAKLPTISEDQIHEEQIQDILKNIAHAVKETDKPNLIWIGVGFSLGVSVILLLANMGYLPIAGR